MRLADRNTWSQTLQRAWLTRGPLAMCLLPVTALYALLSMMRAGLYRHGWRQTYKLSVPVIVVGNLVVGGAGKTPSVIAIVELLRRRGYAPGILSRGYAGNADNADNADNAGSILEVQDDTPPSACGDEPKLLHLRTRAPVFVGRDRVAAGRELLRRHTEVNVLVSDDGLQHHRLARDAQVIVFDERGAGNGWLLPSGPLREPLARACPARSVVLYNAPSPTTHWPGSTAQRSLAGVIEIKAWWQGATASAQPLQALRGRRLLAVAGIANPDRFFNMLRELGLDFEPMPLPDHYPFIALPWPDSEVDVVLTEKDAVKIDPRRVGTARVWVAALDFRTSPDFESALMLLLPTISARGARHGSASA